MGTDCTSRVKEHGASVQDTRETSARMAYAVEAVFKNAEIHLKQAQRGFITTYGGLLLEGQKKGHSAPLTEVKRNKI